MEGVGREGGCWRRDGVGGGREVGCWEGHITFTNISTGS